MEYKSFEAVIGLEVHCELKTESKIFCSCPTVFGAEPNTQCCPVCLGLPGALPALNHRAIELAVKSGLVLGCEISEYSRFDRKNYFYPDLPKGYQISQYDIPLCKNGRVEIELDGEKKLIGITRIHVEEDAGKLIHDKSGTLIDCNRCGVPLIEIVTEPDIRTAEEAKAFVRKLRTLILYSGASDVKMNEGSMRVDVNLSVRRIGEKTLGTRTEMKNLNSINFIGRAIEYEFHRQVDAILSGEKIEQETRRYDQNLGITLSMRKKENLSDYRFFPEPNIPPLILSKEDICRISGEIPVLPDARKAEYVEKFSLTPYDADLITESRAAADYFEQAAKNTRYPKLLGNLFIGEILSKMTDEDANFPLPPEHLAEIADLLGSGAVNSNVAKELIFSDHDISPAETVKQKGLARITDMVLLTELIEKAFSDMPKAIADYKKGKTAALKSIVGRVMGATKGRADPEILQDLVQELAKKI